MDDDYFTLVRVYCCITQNYFGFGLSPAAAANACLEAGAKKTDLKNNKKHFMKMLPGGVSAYAFDNFGTLHWRFPEGTPKERLIEQCTKLVFNPKTYTWDQT